MKELLHNTLKKNFGKLKMRTEPVLGGTADFWTFLHEISPGTGTLLA